MPAELLEERLVETNLGDEGAPLSVPPIVADDRRIVDDAQIRGHNRPSSCGLIGKSAPADALGLLADEPLGVVVERDADPSKEGSQAAAQLDIPAARPERFRLDVDGPCCMDPPSGVGNRPGLEAPP